MRRLTVSLVATGIAVAISGMYLMKPNAGTIPSVGNPSEMVLTIPLKADSVRFAVIGDNGTADNSEIQVGDQMQKAQQISKFGFVIMLGDNLYGGASPRDYQDRFERPYKSLLDRGVLFYASLGNHDDNNEISYVPFHMGGNRYYTHTEGDVEFFVLDTNYMDNTQLDWLQQELQKSKSPWKIAYFHHPLYSSGKAHGPSRELRTVLEPIFEKYGVSAVFSGHDHIYERVNPQNGIQYFVMGASGKLRNGDLKSDSLKAAGFDSDRSFLLVEITGDNMYYEAISRTGDTVDSGVFNKQPPVSIHAGAQTPGPTEGTNAGTPATK